MLYMSLHGCDMKEAQNACIERDSIREFRGH